MNEHCSCIPRSDTRLHGRERLQHSNNMRDWIVRLRLEEVATGLGVRDRSRVELELAAVALEGRDAVELVLRDRQEELLEPVEQDGRLRFVFQALCHEMGRK